MQWSVNRGARTKMIFNELVTQPVSWVMGHEYGSLLKKIMTIQRRGGWDEVSWQLLLLKLLRLHCKDHHWRTTTCLHLQLSRWWLWCNSSAVQHWFNTDTGVPVPLLLQPLKLDARTDDAKPTADCLLNETSLRVEWITATYGWCSLPDFDSAWYSPEALAHLYDDCRPTIVR